MTGARLEWQLTHYTESLFDQFRVVFVSVFGHFGSMFRAGMLHGY